jgi:chromosome partitioning protein
LKVFTIASLKGGSGKSSLAIFLAQALTAAGRRVLVVDLDHNNNLTDYFLRDVQACELEERNVLHAITGRPVEDCLYSTAGLAVMPAVPALASVSAITANDPGAALRFASRLRRLEYDVIVIDSPPALSWELVASLYAADAVISPVGWHRWALQGARLLEAEAAKVAETTGKPIRLVSVPCIVTHAEDEKLRAAGLASTTTATIFKAAIVRNAAGTGRLLPPASDSWAQFVALAKEISAWT